MGDPLGLANGKRPCGAPPARPRSAVRAAKARAVTGGEPGRDRRVSAGFVSTAREGGRFRETL